MVDDIVRLLMGEGQVIDTEPLGQGSESSSSTELDDLQELQFKQLELLNEGEGKSSGSNMMQITTEEEEE